MSHFEKRNDERKRVCMQAFASDVNDTFDIKCIIRDVSLGGCMIVSSSVHELPDMIQLIPEGFDRPLAAKIVWRGDKFAGMAFVSSNDDAVMSEVREYFLNALAACDEDDTLDLNCMIRPLGYADRLARYQPRNR